MKIPFEWEYIEECDTAGFIEHIAALKGMDEADLQDSLPYKWRAKHEFPRLYAQCVLDTETGEITVSKVDWS